MAVGLIIAQSFRNPALHFCEHQDVNSLSYVHLWARMVQSVFVKQMLDAKCPDASPAGGASSDPHQECVGGVFVPPNGPHVSLLINLRGPHVFIVFSPVVSLDTCVLCRVPSGRWVLATSFRAFELRWSMCWTPPT